jgi:hypothetical protein
MRRTVLAIFAPLALAAPAVAQTDSFHLMQIEQVVGGVNGDPSKQAIQLRMRDLFQNFVAGHSIIAYDAQGLNPITIITFSGSVPSGNEGDRILITSAGFTSPVTPDFVMENPIPASYLFAGRIIFGDSFDILWSLSYGGSGYTGPTTGGLTNDLDGEFGPPWAGTLPTASNQGLLFQGAANVMSNANSTDYALTTGAAILTNNAGQSAPIPGASCYPNCDGSTTSPLLNVQDFTCFLQRYAAGESYANCDNSTTAPVLNVQDFTCFLQSYAAGCR